MMNAGAHAVCEPEFKHEVERVKFNCEPGSHEAKFKQLGIFLNKDALKNAVRVGVYAGRPNRV
jgi:hypothetical protein